jgi:hypothetical protein
MMKKRPEGRNSRAGQLTMNFTRSACTCKEEEAVSWLNQHAEDALYDGDPVVIRLLLEVVDHYLHSVRRELVQ